MKLSIIDNAIDFLESAIENLDWILKNDSYYDDEKSTSYLKQLIVSLSSASELLIKICLSDINELLIYNNINEEILRYYKLNSKLTLYDFIIKENIDIMTIDFKECINKLFMVTNISLKYKIYLHKLRMLRNKFIHFGINAEEEYYELMYIISNVLYMLSQEKPTSNILNNYYYGEDSDDRHIFFITCLNISEIVDNIWIKKYKPNIEKIFDVLCESFMESDYRFSKMLEDKEEDTLWLGCIEPKKKEVERL